MHAFLVGKDSIQIATYEGKQSKVSIHSFEAHFNAKASIALPTAQAARTITRMPACLTHRICIM